MVEIKIQAVSLFINFNHVIFEFSTIQGKYLSGAQEGKTKEAESTWASQKAKKRLK